MFLNPNPGPDGKIPPSGPALPPLNPQIAQWFQARQSRLKPVKTTQTPSGQILDWIPIESQVPNGRIATPPAPYSIPSDDKVRPVSTELDDPKVERGPAGTIPVPRKNLGALHVTRSLDDYLSKRGGLLVNDKRTKGPTDPNPFGYFHGTSGQSVKASGCSHWLDVWQPYVQTSEDHSIMQCGLQNYDRPQLQSLEAGWTVDNSLNGDWIPHLFTYYTTNGYTKDGDNIGGYNSDVDGWVQVSSSVYPGIGFSAPYSIQGGAQYGFSLRYYLDYAENNWWLWFQGGSGGQWIGYYPSWLFFGAPGESLFTTLGAVAEWVGFWGEVYSALSNPNQSTTQMGSGDKGEAGWTHACFQKNLLYQPAGSSSLVNQNGSASAEDPSKYDIKTFMNSGGSWGSYFYAGGS
jgi:Neprosin